MTKHSTVNIERSSFTIQSLARQFLAQILLSNGPGIADLIPINHTGFEYLKSNPETLLGEMMLRVSQASITTFIAVVCFALTQSHPADAQEMPPEKLATFAFDVNVERITNNEFVQAIGVNALAEFLDFQGMMPPSSELKDLARFKGAIQLSEKIDLMTPEPSFEFHFQMHFKTETQLEKIKTGLDDAFMELVEANGKSYYKQSQSNFYILYEGKMLEAGTKLYMLHPDRNFLTEKLAAEWNALPKNAAGKCAIDLDASLECLEAFKQELIVSSPIEGMLEPVIEQILENVQFASAFADIENQEMLTLRLTTKDDEAADQVKGVMDGLLFMAALPLKNLINIIPVESEQGSKMLLSMADQLKAKKIDGEVYMNVMKPDSFEEIVRTVYLPEFKEYLDETQTREHLRTLCRAMLNFNSDVSLLPFVKTDPFDWDENLSWRVRVLPGIYENNTRQLVPLSDTAESWEHESNQQIVDRMPPQFGDNGRNSNIVWVKSKTEKISDITDNTRETIAFLRLPEPTEAVWTNPEGDNISMLAAIKLVKNLKDGESVFAVTYGTSVIKLTNKLTHNQLKAYFTPAGGDSPDELP